MEKTTLNVSHTLAFFRSGEFDFTLAGVHTKPDDTEAKIVELADVVAAMSNRRATADAAIHPGNSITRLSRG